MARVRVEVPVEPNQEAVKHHQPEQHQPAQKHGPNQVQPGKWPLKKKLIVLGVILGGIFVFNLMQERNRLAQELDGKKGAGESAEIVKILSKTVELPTDETPESRTIEDASKFTVQNPSLSDIKDGDVLLFFPKSKKVVVYRPSTQKAVVVVTLASATTDTSTTEP